MHGTRWCAKCVDSIEAIQAPFCPVCGRNQDNEYVCPICQIHPPPWNGLRSWAFYGGVIRHAINRLKYQGDMALGEVLAEPLFCILEDAGWDMDLIVPVPLGVEWIKERGYNQASLLGLPISLRYGIPFAPKAIKKIKETPHQVDLSAEARKHNLSGAFLADVSVVDSKNILVVDDVTTTGATMEACSLALQAAGAKCIYGLTLTRAGIYNN